MRRLGPFGPLVICGLALSLLATSAQARSFKLGDLIGRFHSPEQPQQTEPPVAVYVPDDGDPFVLDRSTSPPLMRFQTNPEIWVLQPTPGPHGDMIYKNDLGEPVLRATRLGGMTLFTLQRPDGTAAALEGEAPPLHLPVITTLLALQQRLAQSSLRASRAVQRLIEFEDLNVTPDSATIIADAGEVASQAIISTAKHAYRRHFLDKLEKVTLTPARKPGARYKDGVLEIDLTPGQGLAGRPSSRRIEAAFTH